MANYNSDKVNSIEITEQLMEAVALAQLYREDNIIAIRSVISEKLTNQEMQALYRRIISDERFQQVKDNAIKLEEATLVDDNVATIMLYYNKLLKQAQFSKDYNTAARILKEIRQFKAIENEQMKFEIEISVKEPEQNSSDTKS